LIEFKRPGRTQYQDSENPQLQVERYIRSLQSGTKVDVRGRPIAFSADTVFYCYIVADCVGPMNEWTFSWGRTADGRGRIYQPNSGFKGMIELISWDSLLDDAKTRNWPAPGSEDTELGVLMEPEVDHGEAEVYTRVQA